MKVYVSLLFVVFFVVLFLKTLPKTFDFKTFSTAKGEVDIEEINKNVYEIYGYSLIKNGLIPKLKKKNSMNCDEVFNAWQAVAEKGLTVDPPKVIPNPTAFLLNNYAKLFPWYFNETPANTKKSLKYWNQTYIDDLVKVTKVNPSNVPRSYENEALAVYAATKDFSVEGQSGAVIGSQTPWVEIYALTNGAKHITTVDYYELSINHPQMDFLYAPDLPSQKENFSSIEHSGLGRYGDPMDPIGDIREMNKIHCMLKPKGLLYLGFAVGVDKVAYNAHRVYGRIRLGMMFEGRYSYFLQVFQAHSSGFQLLKIYKNETTVSEQQMLEVFNDERYEKQYLFVLEKQND